MNDLPDKDFLAHFPPKVSQAMVDYARDVAFSWSRYIFTRRQGKQQYGYCTHCQKEFKTEKLKHNDRVNCPECGSSCLVRSSGISRKRLIDEAYFVWYDRSGVDPNTIVATGVYAVRDYRGNYYRVEIQFETAAMYVFEPGKPRMIKRSVYYSEEKDYCMVGRWEKCRSVYSIFNQGHIANIPSTYTRDRIKKLVQSTPFQYSTWEEYNHEDMTRFFALYAKSPCIEYLTKLGMTDLVEAKLRGYNTMGAINWRGKTLLKVLKLSKQEFNEIRKRKLHVSFFLLHILQTSRKLGWGLSLDDALEIEAWDSGYGHYFKDFVKLTVYAPAKKILAYMTKQYKKDKKQYYQKASVLITWRDYISDAIKLEMDVTSEQVLFPKSAWNAHQNTIKQIQIKADEELKRQVAERNAKLKNYRFKYKGLLIRAAATADELIEEGKALNHCVGGYARRHANGECTILFIRKASEPDKPFFTVEVRGDHIVQIQGHSNKQQPTADVWEFVEAFKAQKLTKKKPKSRVKIPA